MLKTFLVGVPGSKSSELMKLEVRPEKITRLDEDENLLNLFQ